MVTGDPDRRIRDYIKEVPQVSRRLGGRQPEAELEATTAIWESEQESFCSRVQCD